MTKEIITSIQDADMVLIGLGEEFDHAVFAKKDEAYEKGRLLLEENNSHWLLPAFESMLCEEKVAESNIVTGLNKLAEILQDKNYFVVSTAMNQAIEQTSWKEGRLVTPCGGMSRKQCVDGCEEGLQDLSEDNEKALADYMNGLKNVLTGDNGDQQKEIGTLKLGVCPKCGKELVLNNIYVENYDENGYLPQWQIYTKWLQGTLNKKLVILELGVGMKFPSVIRWPFEKVAFFNNRAHLYRVNEKLYQLTEDLKGKGTAIPKNSIDWLCSL